MLTPALVDGPVTVYQGDALPVLRGMPDESVHCVVTSPPYWGLRDYGTATWDGGDAACAHLEEPFRTKSSLNANWGAGYSDVKNTDMGRSSRARILAQSPYDCRNPSRLVRRMARLVWMVRDSGRLN